MRDVCELYISNTLLRMILIPTLQLQKREGKPTITPLGGIPLPKVPPSHPALSPATAPNIRADAGAAPSFSDVPPPLPDVPPPGSPSALRSDKQPPKVPVCCHALTVITRLLFSPRRAGRLRYCEPMAPCHLHYPSIHQQTSTARRQADHCLAPQTWHAVQARYASYQLTYHASSTNMQNEDEYEKRAAERKRIREEKKKSEQHEQDARAAALKVGSTRYLIWLTSFDRRWRHHWTLMRPPRVPHCQWTPADHSGRTVR